MVDNFIKIYKELAKVSYPRMAKCSKVMNKPNMVQVSSSWELRDLKRMAKVEFQKSYFYDTVAKSIVNVTSPVEPSPEFLRTYSRDGLWALIKKDAGTKTPGTQKQFIEIWSDAGIVKTIEVAPNDKHLNIITHGQFGTLSFSPSGKQLLYTAERYFKAESFYSNDANKKDEKTSKVLKGEEYLFRQSWGENLADIVNPWLFIIEIETEEIREVQLQNENYSYGRAMWTPDGEGVVSLGWLNDPYKLGITYCGNRQNAIFYFNMKDSTCEIIGSSKDSINERVWFSPNGKYLVYLQSPVFGPHRTAQSLMKVNWDTKEVVKVVKSLPEPNSDGFPGIYSLDLPHRIWLDDNENVILHSINRSVQELYCINVTNGSVTRVELDTETKGDTVLLDVYENVVVAIKSSPDTTPYLVIGAVAVKDGIVKLNWILKNESALEKRSINWEIIKLNPPKDQINSSFPNLDFEAVLLTPKDTSQQPFPLVVIPHGGPHSTFTAGYYLSAAAFCAAGSAVLLVNYRGSLGFGTNNVISLLGNVGTQDVGDVHFAVETVLKNPGIDNERVFVSSGSHGGFLALHLCGQYPNVYKKCIARNPVVSVNDMSSISDISDWCFEESGFPFSYKSIANAKMLEKMWEVSPIKFVDHIKSPVLFVLGSKDLRVPSHQGFLMHKALKARNIESKVYVYDDNHALSNLTSESDALVHMLSWMFLPNQQS